MGNFSRFFIERPIFATVVAILITLAGVIASFNLPVSQYPDISPPTITISTVYPGASAETISQTVAAPIEEQLSGIEGLLYYNSTSSSNGQLSITLTSVTLSFGSAALGSNSANRTPAASPVPSWR